MIDNKVLTILEVRDLLNPALSKGLQQVEGLNTATNQLGAGAESAFSRAGRGLGMLATGAAAFGAAAAAAIQQATQRAQAFNAEFRETRNLNLDKSSAAIEGLKDTILDTALATGRSAIDMNRAFFDIQSGTGKFGQEVAAIATDTSNFTRAFRIDFNTALEAGIRGMKNFNLQASDMERFYGSMVKTVQVGIVTFEQLARVQVDYAGSAAAAGQSVDSANKLFAVFTTRAKSAEEAATLTKSAFTDLLRPSTLEAFQRVGVSVFDTTTGKVRQLDDIVAQLNERFASSRGSDAALTGLINQFSGSEGLTALISEAARNGDNMLNTFRQFDATEFRLGDALRAANADADVLAEVARNKLDVILTKIGQKTLPIWVNLLSYVSDKILPGIIEALPSIEAGLAKMGTALEKTIDQLGAGLSFIKAEVSTFRASLDQGRMAIALSTRGGRQAMNERLQAGRLGRLLLDQGELDKMNPEGRYILSQHIGGLYSKDGNIITPAATALVSELKQSGQAANARTWQLIAELTNQLAEQAPRDQERKRLEDEALAGRGRDIVTATLQGLATQPIPTGPTPTGGADISRASGRGAALHSISSGAGVRQVTVNIQRQVGIENLVTNNLPTSMADLEAMLRTLITRAVRDAELALQS